MNTASAIISGAECISTPSTYHTIHKENHMTSKIVTPTTAEIRERHEAQTVPTWGSESVLLDWSRIHRDRGILLDEITMLCGVIRKIQEENSHPVWEANSDTIALYCKEGLQGISREVSVVPNQLMP